MANILYSSNGFSLGSFMPPGISLNPFKFLFRYLRLLVTRIQRPNKENVEDVFTEEFPYEKGFSQFYKNSIKPHVTSFEEKRLKLLNSAIKRTRWSTLAIPLTCFIFIKFSLISSQYGSLALLLIILAIFYFSTEPSFRYNANLKTEIFPEIISFFENFHYSPECPPLMDELKTFFRIVPQFDQEKNEDLVQGSYKGVKVNFFETKLAVLIKRERDSYYKTVFDGCAVLFSINKKFSGRTVVRRDAGKLGNFFKKESLEKVSLEDPEFEKMFEVYSDDQVEARYLLTTSFMQRLKLVRESFCSKGLECEFYNNNLLIMIPTTQNLFESGSIFVRENFIDDSKNVLKSMNYILQLSDTLKLERNIGM